jgi:phosphotransferase system enzyme I (PtsP)
MAPAAIGPVKGMILALDRGALWRELEPMLAMPDHSLRKRLAAVAAAHGIPIEA